MSQTYTLQKPAVEIPLEKQIEHLFQKKLNKLPVYKDLPRLAGRIKIDKFTPPPPPLQQQQQQTTDNEELPIPDNNNNNGEPIKKRKSKALSLRLSEYFDEKDKLDVDKIEPLKEEVETPDSKVWKQVKKVLFKLSEVFEDQKTQNIIKQTFNDSKQPSDYQLSLPTLFNDCMNEETSKVIKILKLIHQNIIYIGCYELKLRVPFLLANMTKDVRGEHGWQINIFESKDTVTVTHIRREESLPSSPIDKQFQLEWQLHIVLNKEMTEITHSNLRITDLIFGEKINPQFKSEITKSLCNGNLFIC